MEKSRQNPQKNKIMTVIIIILYTASDLPIIVKLCLFKRQTKKHIPNTIKDTIIIIVLSLSKYKITTSKAYELHGVYYMPILFNHFKRL